MARKLTTCNTNQINSKWYNAQSTFVRIYLVLSFDVEKCVTFLNLFLRVICTHLLLLLQELVSHTPSLSLPVHIFPINPSSVNYIQSLTLHSGVHMLFRGAAIVCDSESPLQLKIGLGIRLKVRDHQN